MSEAQYIQYQNLHIFAEKWRKYKHVGTIYTKKEFVTNMQSEECVMLQYVNPASSKPVLLYLLSANSKYNNNSQNLRGLLARIKEPTDVIIVSSEVFKTYSIRTIAKFKTLRVKTYLHENFDLIIPNGPLCYPHRILSFEEVNNLLNKEISCKLINLPKILQEDVQCIWIGAEVGDVIEITQLSDITGESIQYRVVIPKSGKTINFRTETTTAPAAADAENEDEDEEIQEIREKTNNSDVESDED
jgi:DNA-directed RNA polymerase subunit H (RpoH/RPB5)